MSKVMAGFSMSLDGFVADRDDGIGQVFKWYSAGGTDAEVMAGDKDVLDGAPSLTWQCLQLGYVDMQTAMTELSEVFQPQTAWLGDDAAEIR